MARVYVNNVSTKLTAQLLAGGLTANVTAGDGARFAAAVAPDYIVATIRRISGFKDVAREIVRVTARATDALTITRAQEGTAALQFEIGDQLDVDFTAATFNDFTSQALPRIAAGGTVDAITATYAPALTALEDRILAAFISSGANTSATPTFAPNGLTARTIVARGGAALLAGDIGPAGFVAIVEYNLANTRWELLNPIKTRASIDLIGLSVAGGGTVSAITATYVPAVTTLLDKQILGFTSVGVNTSTAPTFSPNGLTARTIVSRGGLALALGDLGPVGHQVLLQYDLANTRWELLNPIDLLRGGAAPTVAGRPVSMSGLAYKAGIGVNLAIGTTDLYTVPAGKCALIGASTRCYNQSAGTISVIPNIKVSGVYYALASTANVNTLAGTAISFTHPIILNAGESFAVVTGTNNGLNIRFNVWEFDATDTRLLGARILSLANGNNTLLTVPAGKSIVPHHPSTLLNLNGGDMGIGTIAVFNTTGGAISYGVHMVPSGQSVGENYRMSPAQAIGALNGIRMEGFATMVAGDFVNVNASAGPAGIAWTIYGQIP